MNYDEIMQKIDYLDDVMKEYFKSSSFQDFANQKGPQAILVDECWLHIRDIARAKAINTHNHLGNSDNDMSKIAQWLKVMELISHKANDKEIRNALNVCYGTNPPSDDITANVYDAIYGIMKNFIKCVFQISPSYSLILDEEKKDNV